MLKCGSWNANADGSFVPFGIWSLDYEWRVPKGMMLLRSSQSVIQICPETESKYSFYMPKYVYVLMRFRSNLM
ncbi:unnamed protein product [Prunus brigantina]